MPLTPTGVQCPTAQVQKVRVVVASYVQTTSVKDCCAKKVVERAPKPGEQNFKQCRCAEKKVGGEREMRTIEAMAPLQPGQWMIEKEERISVQIETRSIRQAGQGRSAPVPPPPLRSKASI